MNPRTRSLRPRPLPVVQIGEVAVDPTAPRWLVRELWSASSVGLVAGAAKSYKSWLGLDLAMSVASGTPALGRYPVETPGRVLMYLAEDALPSVRERVASIARHRGLELRALDLHAITAPRLRLDVEEDRLRLLETARSLKPRMLLLDPLVRLHTADENDACQIAQILGYLRSFQRTLDVSVVLVHHTRKYVPAGARAGEGLRGSGDLHAFGDSNLYLRRTRDKLVLSVEHRSAPAPPPVCLRLDASDERAVHLEVTGEAPDETDRGAQALSERVLEVLSRHGSPMNRVQLREALGVKNERLGHALALLSEERRIVRDRSGWRLAGEPTSARSFP